LNIPFWLDEPAPAYGPLRGDERADVAIVGGGVTGLACARILASEGARVRLLEARRVGSGASGRNGGFALRGTALPYDRGRLPELVRLTEEALGRIAELAGDAFRPVGSLRVAVDAEEHEALGAEHDALSADGFAVDWRSRDELPVALRRHSLGGLFHPVDGALEQGRWVRRLAALADEAGALIAEDTRATRIREGAVITERGTVTANAVLVATDGYTHGLVGELDEAIVVFRGQVVSTEPLAEQLLACPIYARWGYDYLQQLPDGRLVAGGRRDTDLEAETTREERTTDSVQRRLEALVRDLVGDRVRITHRWAGLMGFTDDFLPLVGPLREHDRLWVSAGYSGHGNVLGFACGEAVAHALLGRGLDGRLAPLSPERNRAARPPA
jgi:gamma-glutamylputrescine oxidase